MLNTNEANYFLKDKTKQQQLHNICTHLHSKHNNNDT